MRPTIEYLRGKFAEYNQLLFGGQLPEPRFGLMTGKGRMGSTQYRFVRDARGNKKPIDFLIRISVRYDLSEVEVIDTLVHEMIHYYIAYNQIADTSQHGEVFCRMMDCINREHGIKVSLSFTPSEEDLATNLHPSWHYLCLFQSVDGQKCLAVVARSRLFELWDAYKVEAKDGICKWYASNHTFFDKFRKTTSGKYYIVNGMDVESHLTNAYTLVRDGNVIRPVK